MLGCNRYLS